MTRTPPTRTWVDTSTPKARADISAAVADVLEAHEALRQARKRRNQVIRRHRDVGVDPRDLVRICREAGWPRCAANTIHTIVSGDSPDE